MYYDLYRTLYCAKGNYEFGAARIMKSLEPYNKKVLTVEILATIISKIYN